MRNILVVAAMQVLSSEAFADETNSQAADLYDAGRALMERGEIAAACAKFDSSLALDPTLDTRVALAACRERNRQFATALGVVMRALDASASSQDATDLALRNDLKAQAELLRPRISKLTIAIAPGAQVPGLEIRRGGTIVTTGEWNTPLSIDGGTYEIVVRAPGHRQWTGSVVVKDERDTQTFTIPALEREAVEPTRDPEQPAEPPRRRGSRLGAYLGIGSALVLGAGAIGVELSGRGLLDDAKVEPDDAKQDQLFDSANTRHVVAQGLGVASLACAGVGIWLLVHNRGAAADQAVTVSPSASLGFVGIDMRGRW